MTARAQLAPRVDDVVIGILTELTKKSQTFTADRVALHRAFVELKSQYSMELAGLRFRDRGVFAESQELDQAICSLEASGLLHRKNQTPLYYEADPALPKTFSMFSRQRLSKYGVDDTRVAAMGEALSSLLPSVG